MAYDEDLADQIRELLSEQGGVTEKKMFGGLAFLIGGNMAIAASGQGGVLVRVDRVGAENSSGHAEQAFRATRSDRRGAGSPPRACWNATNTS